MLVIYNFFFFNFWIWFPSYCSFPTPRKKNNNGTYWNNGTFQLLSNAKKFQEELEERLTFCIMDIMGTLANLEGKLGIGCCWQEGSGNTGGG